MIEALPTTRAPSSKPPVRVRLVAPAFLFMVVMPLASAGAVAQTAQLGGRLTDSTSAVLPGAAISVGNVETGMTREAVSNEEGYYTVPFLPPGSYTITVRLAGFKQARRDGVVLSAGDSARVDFQLELGPLQDEVRVDASASRLRHESSSLGQAISTDTMVSLPLNGRNYAQVATLSAGVVPNPGSRTRTDGLNLNGNRATQNNFLIDGLDNNNYLVGIGTGSAQAIRPPVEAIQEFRVETAGYGAEHGSAAGGLISVIIKSGTNAFRGSASDFFRHERLEANDFFAKRAGLEKAPFRYHQFGGVVGGPIVRNRSFFFGSYQGARERNTYTATVTVPTVEMVRGEFGAVAIHDPRNVVNAVRQPFPNNTIPPNRLDPVGRRIASLYPPPNRPGLINNFVGFVPRTDERDQIDARVDHRVSDASRVFLRYSRSDREVAQGSFFGPPGNGHPGVAALAEQVQLPTVNTIIPVSLAVGHTLVVSSAVVNELRVGYTSNRADQRNLATSALFEEFGLQGIPPVPGLTGLPVFNITGFGLLGDRTQLPYRPSTRIVHIANNLSWARGAHTMKLGGEIRLKRSSIENLQAARGNFSFSGQFTSRLPGGSGGSGLADLLLGQTGTARLSTPMEADFADRYYGAYVSDSWRVSSDLTLNLGLRYEVQTPMWELRNRMANFDLDPQSGTVGTLVPARDGDFRARTFSVVDTNNLAPRLGFALRRSPAMVVRGAYGVFYGNLGYQAAALSGMANPPYFVRVAFTSPRDAAVSNLVLADGFPADALNPKNAGTIEAFATRPDLPLGTVHQWTLGLERKLFAQTAVSVTYVGSESGGLRGINNANAPVPGRGSQAERRPFPSFGDILESRDFVAASYHGLQVSAERRLTGGFAWSSAYTWSHAIDTATDAADTPNPIVPQNPNDIGAEKASANFDLRHRFASSIIYEVPIGRPGRLLADRRLARWVLGGWSVAAIFVTQTGFPLSPTLGSNPANTTTPARPDCRRDGNLPRGERTIDRWYDASAFEIPAQFTFGNCGRHVLRAPGFTNFDLLIAREFRVAAGKRLELRAEVFNLTNAVHLGQPDLLIDQPQAGRITSTQAPARQMQLGLRFVF
jgi:hypothetical protein